MTALRKQRSDATLKTLPEVVQQQLFALIRTKSYAEVRKIAAEKWQVETSAAALSEFYRWYPLSRRIEAAKDTADEVAKVLRSLGDVNLDDDKIQRAAQAMFEAQAMKAGDADTFIGLRKLRLKEGDQKLARSALELKVKQYEDKIAAARASLEKAKSKGGLDKSTLALIEEQLRLL